MINLLPSVEKQKLVLKERQKLTIIWLIIILVFLTCLFLVLLLIELYISSETDYQRNILSQSSQQQKNGVLADLNNSIQKYNNTLTRIEAFNQKEIKFDNSFEIITGMPVPVGVYPINFSIIKDDSGIVKVNISGVSDTRDNLLIFKKNMEQNGQIKNLYFSPESWVNQKNVDFTLTFEVD